MPLTECPECKEKSILIEEDELFMGVEINYKGNIIFPESPIACVCNNEIYDEKKKEYIPCPQKFWYYLRTGRITKRNK